MGFRDKYKKFFLGGLIEGEGSLVVVVRKRKNLKFGVSIDPEFYIYQHKKRKKLLQMAKEIFATGSIYAKTDNPNVLVYAIRDRRTIAEKVIPFFKKYVLPFGVKYNAAFPVFEKIVQQMMQKKHLTQKGVDQLLSLVKQFKKLLN